MSPKTTATKRPGQTPKPQRPVSKLIFFTAIGVTLACTVTLVWQAIRGVPTEEFGYAPHVLLLLVLALFVTASLAVTEVFPWSSRSLREWQRPKVMGSFVGLILGALGLVVGLTSMFNLPAATEKSLTSVRQSLEAGGITRGKDSLVERHISGTWGEPGCDVTYEFALNQGLLSIASKKSVLGQSPLAMELAAEPGTSRRMVTSVVMPVLERGDQHEFLYETAGSREFLTWVIKKREISLKLDRCSQGG
jgi:hypothetical protein